MLPVWVDFPSADVKASFEQVAEEKSGVIEREHFRKKCYRELDELGKIFKSAVTYVEYLIANKKALFWELQFETSTTQ